MICEIYCTLLTFSPSPGTKSILDFITSFYSFNLCTQFFIVIACHIPDCRSKAHNIHWYIHTFNKTELKSNYNVKAHGTLKSFNKKQEETR